MPILTIELPKENYTMEVINGKTYYVCTLRQMVLHTIGLDGYGRPYTRHGRKFYRPYRNYFTTTHVSAAFQPLVDAGYVTEETFPRGPDGSDGYLYCLTRTGMDWLGERIGVKIYDIR